MSGTATQAKALRRGEWIETGNGKERVVNVVLTPVDRDVLVVFEGGRTVVYPTTDTLIVVPAPKPAVTPEQLAAKIRQGFISYARGSNNKAKPAQQRRDASVAAGALAEMLFYAETGLDLMEDTRGRFEDFLAALFKTVQ